MTDAPERIWVDYAPYTEDWGFVSDEDCGGCTQYIRADIHEARVKELEEALTKILSAENEMIWGEDAEIAAVLMVAIDAATAALRGSTND